MRVLLQPKQREHLAQIAVSRGVTAAQLVQEIIVRYLEDDKRLVTSVKGGIAAADRGEPLERKRVGPGLSKQPEGGLGTELAALFPKHGPDFVIESPFEPPAKAAGLRTADSRGRLSPHKPSPQKSSRSRRKKRA